MLIIGVSLEIRYIAICDCCIGYILYMVLYRVFPFKYYIHELVSLIQFMYELVLLVHVFIYGFMVAVILGYDWNVPYILLWYYPYVMGIIPLCYNP